MKIDTSLPITNINGENYKDEKKKPVQLGQFLATYLANEPGCETPQVNYKLAMKLNKSDTPVAIDGVELEVLKKAIDKAQEIPLIKGQILDIISSLA